MDTVNFGGNSFYEVSDEEIFWSAGRPAFKDRKLSSLEEKVKKEAGHLHSGLQHEVAAQPRLAQSFLRGCPPRSCPALGVNLAAPSHSSLSGSVETNDDVVVVLRSIFCSPLPYAREKFGSPVTTSSQKGSSRVGRTMFAGNPILDEIKQGFKLRPTKTVDKSKPVIVAEIDDADSIAPTKRTAPPAALEVDTAPSPSPSPRASPSPRSSPRPGLSAAAPPPPFPGSTSGGAPPPPPPPPGGLAPPPPPPPPGGGSVPPPPPPPLLSDKKSRKSPSPFPQLGGKTPADIDLGELLHSIQGGVRLRKTVTNDKSGLIVDETMKEKCVQFVEPAPSTAYIPPKKDPPRKDFPRARSPRDNSHLQVDASDDERFLTPTGRGSEYGTPEPDSPRFSRNSPAREERKSIDCAFTEKSLKVTKEDLEQEIPTGTAAARIAKWAGMQGAGNENADSGATLPRVIRPSPIRFLTPQEVNNNANINKPKTPSKWAPVEIGGLRHATAVNVPLDRNERAHSEVRTTRTNSFLSEPNGSQFERARTQSPVPRDPIINEPAPATKTGPKSELDGSKNARKQVADDDKPTRKSAVDDNRFGRKALVENTKFDRKTAVEDTKPLRKSAVEDIKSIRKPAAEDAKITQKSKIQEIRVKTENPPSLPRTEPPSINEIPPSPKTSISSPYSYSRAADTFRNKSPAGRASPTPSQSSTSIPSPSSISPGSTSPETPRRRNPAFDKAKEKFAGGLEATSPNSNRTKERSASPSLLIVDATNKSTDSTKKRVINVPISAPWYHRSLSSSDTLDNTTRARRVMVSMDTFDDPFATIDPDTFRRNYRFNIDLSSDSPLSIINR